MDSETKHVAIMVAKIEQFDLEDPNINDGTGEFNPDNFGAHFTENYIALTELDSAESPLLQALKNGALIEELDMHDIFYCPQVIIDADADDDITEMFDCGMDYTDAKALIRSYGNLLDGSENHLRAFVRVIETNFPDEYPYQAQYLEQTEVDEILGR